MGHANVTDKTHTRIGQEKLNRSLKQTNLTEDQQDAVKMALSEKGQIVGIQGYAGTGKTYAMEKLQLYARKDGYKLETYAPSHKAVSELGKALPQTRTLQSLVTQERNHPEETDKSNKIILVDEAAMISNKDMVTLLDHASRTNAARLVLVGDVKQLDSVSAGTPFDLMQKSGMPIAVMDDI